MSKHVNEVPCPSCDEKLLKVNNELVNWFRWVKINHPNVHIAWGWRGQLEQDAMFNAIPKRSEKEWPHSKHNIEDADGKPCAEALDLFQENEHGIAFWDPAFYAKLFDESTLASYKLVWGGNFLSLRDGCHFELQK